MLRTISRRAASTAAAKRIVLLRGDGVGPEVVEAALTVLDKVGKFEYTEGLIGGHALDERGVPLPDDTLAACKASDAVLLGAVGGPKWDKRSITEGRPEQGLLRLRKEMQLFANLRPATVFKSLAAACPLRPELIDGVDILVVRELTGGLYFGERREEDESGSATDTLTYSIAEVERIVRVAGTFAKSRKGRLLSVDKANVLASSRLWRRVATKVMAEEFPGVELSHGLVDSVAMDIIRKPASFDVIVTENLFGDILSDETSVLAGSLGLLPSASVGVEGTPGLFEPIHGSAPDIAGQGKCNPIATILSCAMMLRVFGMHNEAQAIEVAVNKALEDGLRTPDLLLADKTSKAIGTMEMAKGICDRLELA